MAPPSTKSRKEQMMSMFYAYLGAILVVVGLWFFHRIEKNPDPNKTAILGLVTLTIALTLVAISKGYI